MENLEIDRIDDNLTIDYVENNLESNSMDCCYDANLLLNEISKSESI